MLRSVTRSVIVLSLLFLVSCATTGPGGKQSLILIPTATEVSIGEGMASQIAAAEAALDDEVWQTYLTNVGNAIVAVSDRKDISYTFTVIESDQVNAFAAPGGYIYFYTGLLKEMSSEAELAAVVSHEISHVVARHSIKRLQTALGVSLVTELVFGDSDNDVLYTAVNLGLNLAMAGYSREAEREADDFGIHYMKLAGYDPNGAIDMFETLARLGSGGSSVFEDLVSTHPNTQERIANARNQIMAMGTLRQDLRVGADRYQRMKARLP